MSPVDETMHEIFFDEASAEAIHPEKRSMHLPARGRYRISNIPIDPDGTRVDIDIRIDDECGMVSGDVFAATKPRTLPHWHYSFYGAPSHLVKTASQRKLLVPCSVNMKDLPDNNAKGTLILTLSETGAPSCAFTLLINRGAFLPRHFWTVEALSDPDPMFREIRLLVETTSFSGDEPDYFAAAQEAIKLLQDDGPMSVQHAMRHTGLKVSFILKPFDVSATSKLAENFETETVRLVQEMAARALENDPSAQAFDWTHFIFFAALNKREASKPIAKVLDYGNAVGLGTARSRFQSRVGAVINLGSIFETIDDAPIDGGSEIDKFAWMLRYTVVHEIAHCLNIPHSWDRDMGHELLGPARPDSQTWSNYGARFPHGDHVAQVYQGEKDQKTRVQIRKKRRAFFKSFAIDRGFDQDETRFLRHAPLPQIRQGGATFLDHEIPAPRLRKRTNPNGARLVIGAEIGGRIRETGFVQLPIILGPVQEYAPLPVWTVLFDSNSLEQSEKDRKYFDFNFNSGALQLILRPSDPNITEPTHRPKEPIALDIKDLIGGTLDLADLEQVSGTEDLVFAEPLPKITRQALDQQLGVAPDGFWLQAVYYLGKDTLWSNILQVEYDGFVEADTAKATDAVSYQVIGREGRALDISPTSGLKRSIFNGGV